MRSKFCKSVLQDMKKHFFDLTDKKIVVGFSGGVDSLGLLLWCLKIKTEFNMEVIAVHINHNIREEAIRDAKFCEDFCKQNNVKFICQEFDIKSISKKENLSEEECGRIYRRRTFEKVLREYNFDHIFLAHHMEDRCETIIHNIIRGTGIDGLSGIRFENKKYIRPFLYRTKDEIIRFVKENNLTWVEDYTNKNINYTRNYIRKEILPKMVSVNNKALSHICALGDKSIEIKETLDGTGDIYIKKNKVRSIIKNLSGSLKDITDTHISSVVELLEKQVGKEVILPYEIKAVRTYNDIKFIKKDQIMFLFKTSKECTNKIEITENDLKKHFDFKVIHLEDTLENNENKFKQYIENEEYTKYFDYDIIKECDLEFRYKKQGDYINISDSHKVMLKKFFVDNKIPQELRDSIPLVTRENEVIWIVGYRINNNYKLRKNTKNILKISYKGWE